MEESKGVKKPSLDVFFNTYPPSLPAIDKILNTPL